MSDHHHNPETTWCHLSPNHSTTWAIMLGVCICIVVVLHAVLAKSCGFHWASTVTFLKAKVAVLKQKSRHRKSCLEDVRIMIDLNRPWKALTFNALIRKLIAKLWRPIKTSSFNDDYAMIMVCSLKRCLSFWYKSNLWASIGYLFQLRHTQNASGEFEARNWQLTRPEHLVYDAVSVVLACWGIAS